ncbi:hypothetical protein HYPDE_31393 [Hyphomicrobium denitrificans 1NES1]|uniref:Lipoprotein n=1 Tax=Hyphomicrobium denitrificans 1NES1 TaxID=670307 RepID=N0B4M6_9HYPH|nr:hypothetical protein [Hyphomicrobium denitrificans]AGK57953.1 hypothetical protein HYPDE_31393 [Hyphomicrobium denitrificans 1NES1]
MADRARNAFRSEAGIRSAWPNFLIANAAAALLCGCSANLGDLSTSSVAAYQPASLFSPNGYSVSANADGSLHVTAAGSPGTPATRLEKIALARAAEYGDERHAKSFKATSAQTAITCGKTKIANKDGQINVKPLDYRVVAIDVTYEPNGQDAGTRQTGETANALKAELQSETVPPEVQAAAAQEVAQYCRR